MGWKWLLRLRWVDVITFVGVALTINEAIVRHGDPRPDLLVLYAGMMGVSLTTRADELRRDVRDMRRKRESEHE